MTFAIVSLLATPGSQVSAGQALLVMEAMKMEHILRADRDGVIAALPCRQGDQVSQGTLLVHFATDHDETDEQGEAP